MAEQNTPKPGSKEYNVENTENLNKPKFNSTTDRRSSEELPGIENMNDELDSGDINTEDAPLNPDLGNDREDDEQERERIIEK